MIPAQNEASFFRAYRYARAVQQEAVNIPISFPEQKQGNASQEAQYVVLAMILGMIGGVAWFNFDSASWGMLLCLPLVFFMGLPIVRALENRSLQSQWAHSFERRLRPREVAPFVAADPGRYRMHVRFFRQIGRTQASPHCLIQDTGTGELIPVYPSSWEAVHAGRHAGVREEQYLDTPLPRAPALPQ